jgi:hypothetical protein
MMELDAGFPMSVRKQRRQICRLDVCRAGLGLEAKTKQAVHAESRRCSVRHFGAAIYAVQSNRHHTLTYE